jgi:hypothetical protein
VVAVVVLPDDKRDELAVLHDIPVVPHPVIAESVPIQHSVSIHHISDVRHHYVPSPGPFLVEEDGHILSECDKICI